MSFQYIRDNYSNLQQKINSACERCGRNAGEITLVAVSKTFPTEDITAVYELGQRDFGENKVQELNAKYEELKHLDIKWHLIGHLQTNKVKYIAEFVHLIHSVDSLKLAKEIQKHAEKAGRVIDILVQVNTSGEDTKSGIEPADTEKLCEEISALANIRLKGLMTIGALTEDENEIRENFRTLKELYGSLKIKHKDFEYLSMGMTSDFEIAIKEGANMLRVGSALFGKRVYNN